MTPTPRQRSRAGAAVLMAIALVIAGAVVWHKSIRRNIWPRNFGVVEAGQIYRSGRLTPAALEQVCTQYRIRTIVDLGAYAAGSPEDLVEQHCAEALDVTRYRIELKGDGTGNPNAYLAALRIINDPAQQPVLVHCAAGAQRTSGCVTLYRTIVEHEPLDEAYPESFRYGHNPRDNPKLKPYLDRWIGPIADHFAKGGSINQDGWKALSPSPLNPGPNLSAQTPDGG